MTDSAENTIKNYANEIIEGFKTSKYKDKLAAISDYKKDCKNFYKLPQHFTFNVKTYSTQPFTSKFVSWNLTVFKVCLNFVDG